MLRSCKSSLLVVPVILLAGLYINTNVFADSNDVDFSITVNPSLTLALSSNTVNFSITPTAQGAYNSANFTVTSATNNAYGYTLVMGTSNVNLTSSTINPVTTEYPTIPTLTESQDGISAADFEASTDSTVLNHYGVAVGANNFNAMKTTNPIKKTTVNNASGADTTTIALASKLDLATVPGTYSTTINFQITANPIPGGLEDAYQSAGKTKTTIGNKEYYAMQDMNSTICSNATVIGDVIEVYDKRDNTIYHIGKLADSNCWLLDNLALDLTAQDASERITASNTNADATSLKALFGIATRDLATDSSGNLAIAGVADWTSGSSYSAPLINKASKDQVNSSDTIEAIRTSKYGIYYNFCAASAGSYCYGDGTNYGASYDRPGTFVDAEYDICPSGWRMSTGGSGEYQNLYDHYSGASGTGEGSKYANFRKALSLPLSGTIFGDGSVNYQGSRGYFWSSTYGGYRDMYSLYASTAGIFPQDGDRRDYGLSVRCVAQ